MNATNKESLTKQDVIDLVMEDIENNGPIMKKLEKFFYTKSIKILSYGQVYSNWEFPNNTKIE